MTAGTLSTIANYLEPRDRHGRRCDDASNAVRRARLDPDHVFHVPASPPAPAATTAGTPPPTGWADQSEYEARGLLNLLAFATRCLAGPDARSDERERWRTEITRANERLETLYAAGLPRDFLTNPRR